MAKRKQVLSISVLQSVIDKADEMVETYTEDYPSRSRYFELAGIKLYRSLKEKERRQNNG